MTHKKAPAGDRGRKGESLKTMTKGNILYQKHRYFLALKNAPLTNRMACIAANVPTEAGCRYKRQLEKEKVLQIAYRGIDPDTRCAANFLTTNVEKGGAKCN